MSLAQLALGKLFSVWVRSHSETSSSIFETVLSYSKKMSLNQLKKNPTKWNSSAFKAKHEYSMKTPVSVSSWGSDTHKPNSLDKCPWARENKAVLIFLQTPWRHVNELFGLLLLLEFQSCVCPSDAHILLCHSHGSNIQSLFNATLRQEILLFWKEYEPFVAFHSVWRNSVSQVVPVLCIMVDLHAHVLMEKTDLCVQSNSFFAKILCVLLSLSKSWKQFQKLKVNGEKKLWTFKESQHHSNV